ncbi:hypothetical protein HOU03_gp107 [Caulobacter phage CcrSC]|uniref:Uncharacterized protein n=1 Tax=Caulobacter phage CcrSC TaxID=2283272 RepID=A0A385EG16_9CAUD|nr:hypothetical protein HOU03_gp107 [Caulobacter phage CcrSC]AXQ69689.1 hypothetical protein CcrSC_gp107 [Caulobacter phage CcrSC]
MTTDWRRVSYIEETLKKMGDLTLREIAEWIDDLTVQVDHLEAENARLANEIDDLETQMAGEDL